MYFRKIATDCYKFYKYLYSECGGISSELILEKILKLIIIIVTEKLITSK